jgi:hypothetical protein
MPALTRRAIPVPAKKLGWSTTAMCTLARRCTRTGFAARYPQPAQEVALSNQYWVCSSVQPGTAKRPGAVTPWLGRTMTCWRVSNRNVGGLARCSVAALAEAHRVINRPMVKTERIAIAPNRPVAVLRGPNRPPDATRTVPASHSWGESELGPFQRAALGLEEKLPAIDHVVRAAMVPSRSGFTISQIGGIMGACPPPG